MHHEHIGRGCIRCGRRGHPLRNEPARGSPPAGAFFFDCVATRLRLGQQFGEELAAVQRELGPVPFAGFNTYGQIAQADGQFNGFHNCTAVVCVFPA